MSAMAKSLDQWFEVKVRVNGQVQTLHYPARNKDQAVIKAGGKRRVVGVKKVEREKLFGDIEQLTLEQKPLGLYLGDGVFENSFNFDELLGLRRAKRIENRKKDKKGLA